MPEQYVIDAHSLLWFLENNPRLGSNARAAMQDFDSRLVVPAIALAEVCRVAEKKRSTIPSVEDLLAALDADVRINIDPVDRDLVVRATALTSVDEMHDRLIVATAIRCREQNPSVVLLTKDMNILNSGLIATDW